MWTLLPLPDGLLPVPELARPSLHVGSHMSCAIYHKVEELELEKQVSDTQISRNWDGGKMLRAGGVKAEVAGRFAPQQLSLAIPRAACALSSGRVARGSVYRAADPWSQGGDEQCRF